MKIITRQSLANGAAERWAEQYKGTTRKPAKPDHIDIGNKLAALPQPVDPDEVDRIIGNTSWTTPTSCSICKKWNGPVVELGEEPDYESNTAWICFDCMRKIVKEFEEFHKKAIGV